MDETKAIPVCCALPEAGLRARIDEIEATVARRIVEVCEVDAGFALRFRDDPGVIEELGRFIAFERVCCAFLDFSLIVAAGGGPVWLTLSGAPEAKEFLRPAIARWTA